MQDHQLKEALANWRPMIKKYQQPDSKKAITQLLNSFLPFLGLCVLMYFSLEWSYLLTLALAALTSFFLVRLFIIQHDCGHQSFTKSKKWNNIIGFIFSFFSTIPYKSWSYMHNIHHAHNGQLDDEYRGLGDMPYLTTEEFGELSRWGKFCYRFSRNPFILFLIGPMIYLAFNQRYLHGGLRKSKKVLRSHRINNLMLAIIYTLLVIFVGWKYMVLVYVPILLFFGTIAFWFFYVQHQHEENYKEIKSKWDHLLASIKGSTYYKLPKIFHWLTGNIGYHHIHHLNSRIPNYNLEACVTENPLLSKYVPTVTFWQSLKCINHKLWDPKSKRMISFREYARMTKAKPA